MGKRGGGGYRGRNRPKRTREPGGYAADGGNKGYEEVVRENPKLIAYYKLQSFFSDPGEFDRFAEMLKAPLPSTFRITGMRDTATVFRDMIEKRYISELNGIEVDGVMCEGPTPVGFYPNRLAWTFDVPRQFIRKNPRLKKFKQFLVAMNEKGNLSRQEAVSMIPPLVLDVQPHHKVLDMCAAPGSKTAQIIEMLHADSATQPTGLVIANDSDNKRCYILTKQTKRLQSPNFMVTNLDATRFPTIKVPSTTEPSRLEPLKFDRILCDVPCSGDGTIRKNPKVWQNWNQMAAVGLHKMQFRIAYRGAQLLEVGGRLVYSTCSFNPIENEAVVANLLRSTQGALELVEASTILPELKYTAGISSWVVAEKYGKVLPLHSEIDPQLKKQFVASMWPPSQEEASAMHLNRCLRVFPHQQNTGGFFIAVFKKNAPLPPRDGHGAVSKRVNAPSEPASSTVASGISEDRNNAVAAVAPVADAAVKVEPNISSNTNSELPKKASLQGETEPQPFKASQRGYKEDPFIFNSPNDDNDYWPPVKTFYGFDDSFKQTNLVTRTEGSQKRHIYFVSDLVRKVIQNNQTDALRIINCGVKVLTRSDAKNKPCDYRLCMDGIFSTFPFLVQSMKRVATCTMHDLTLAIREEGAKFEELSQSLQQHIQDIEPGCMVLNYAPEIDRADGDISCPIQVTVWRADKHVRTLVSKDDRMFFNILLNVPDKTDNTSEKADDGIVESRESSELADSGEPVPKRPRVDDCVGNQNIASKAE